jgi:subtilase family serine protease
MRKPSRYLASLFGLTALASLAAVPLAGVTPGSIAAAATLRAVPAVASGGLAYNGTPPFYVKGVEANASGTFSCQAPQSSSNPVPCYGPSQIRNAYAVPKYLTGAGKTIAIIDAFGDPYIASDLATFDSTFGLPAANLNIICVGHTAATIPCSFSPPINDDQLSWAVEIALDTQYAHAIAPGATINLVISETDNDPDILAAQQYVINNKLGDVLSQSFGENELCLQSETSIFNATVAAFQQAESENMSVFASAGDQGAATINCPGTAYVEGVNMPASDPLVTSVGGTHLNANFVTGAYQSETVWNDSGETPDFGAGGGGFSSIFAKPSYQDSAHTGSNFRGVPDVTYSGDVYNGVLVKSTAFDIAEGAPSTAFAIVGGTSAGSPQWAALTALADQSAGRDLGFMNPLLYEIGTNPLLSFAFHDITVGNNNWDVADVGGYSAHRGWDAASGLGSPVATLLIEELGRT